MIDYTRTQIDKTSFNNMFEAIERIKNGYVVSTMYGSTKYCTKDETRKASLFYVVTDSYRQKMTPMTMKLRRWQKESLQEVKLVDNDEARDRKVFWIED